MRVPGGKLSRARRARVLMTYGNRPMSAGRPRSKPRNDCAIPVGWPASAVTSIATRGPSVTAAPSGLRYEMEQRAGAERQLHALHDIEARGDDLVPSVECVVVVGVRRLV